MLTKFRNFFANDKVFLLSTIIAIIGSIFNGFYVIINNSNYFNGFASFCQVVCIIVLYTSYQHHEKNVMKGIIGTLLGIKVLFYAYTVSNAISYLRLFEIPFSYLDISNTILLVVSLLFTINHYLINSDHHSNPTRVFLNQLLIIVNAIVVIAVYASLLRLLIIGGSSTLNIIVVAVCGIGAVVSYNVVACVETRLDVYRVEREANGWKPEDSK